VLDPLEDLNQLRADAEVQLRKNHNKKDGET
jgi:hypothetical protein